MTHFRKVSLYVLPYGQMSYWGATVITNLLSAIPVFGKDLVELIWKTDLILNLIIIYSNGLQDIAIKNCFYCLFLIFIININRLFQKISLLYDELLKTPDYFIFFLLNKNIIFFLKNYRY